MEELVTALRNLKAQAALVVGSESESTRKSVSKMLLETVKRHVETFARVTAALDSSSYGKSLSAWTDLLTWARQWFAGGDADAFRFLEGQRMLAFVTTTRFHLPMFPVYMSIGYGYDFHWWKSASGCVRELATCLRVDSWRDGDAWSRDVWRVW